MKIIRAVISLFILAILSISIFGCNTTKNSNPIANAYITIDINPSVEIITGDDGLVVQVNALNDDAATLLIDTNFTGKTVEEVVDAITTLAMEMGYIDINEENAIIVTAEATTVEDTVELENKINETVNKFANKKNIRMNVLKGNNAATAEMREQAQALNISVGKLKLIQQAMKFDETLTLETAAEMSVKDINRIIINARAEMKDFITEEQRENFLRLRMQLKETLLITKVQLIYDAMLIAEDSVFDPVLTDTVTVQQIKDLYLNYLDELKVVQSSTIVEDVNLELNEILNSDTELQALKTQLEQLQLEINELQKQFRNRGQNNDFESLRTQLKDKIAQRQSVIEQIKVLIEAHIDTYMEAHPDVHIEVRRINGEITFIVHNDRRAQYEEIKVKYEGLFLDLGINLETLEELFVPSIEVELQEAKDQIQNQLEEMKTNARNQAQTIRNQMREQKETFKDLWRR